MTRVARAGGGYHASMQRRSAIASLAALACLRPRAARAAPWLPAAAPVSGGVAIVALGDASAARPTASFGGRPVLVLAQGAAWVAVVGIGLATDAKQPLYLAVKEADGRTRELAFKLQPKQYAEQRLSVAPKHVDLSPQDIARY